MINWLLHQSTGIFISQGSQATPLQDIFQRRADVVAQYIQLSSSCKNSSKTLTKTRCVVQQRTPVTEECIRPVAGQDQLDLVEHYDNTQLLLDHIDNLRYLVFEDFEVSLSQIM